ncbi:hypothetical protein GYMLUDRAFT_935360 [Collybiopsis luxurians FD-317 M1]|nr:hypothetical protein GYMLUDRAFT_935360 [Collybiopsis luxurians FD-317 M1]
MVTFDNTHITELTDLINRAVENVIDEYAAVGQPVPSLDSLSAGPFDTPAKMPTSLVKAVRIIEAACAQLTMIASPPCSVILNKALQHTETACLSVMTEGRIANHLMSYPEGLPVTELAARSGIDAGKLTRMLRLLATKHCFKEVKPGVFANNRLSMKLVSSDPSSSMVEHLVDDGLRASACLNDTLTKPCTNDNGIPFQRAVGYPFFHFDQQPDGAMRGERFARAMIGWGDVLGKEHFLAKVYPWASQPLDTTICDVAGSNGYVTMNLCKVYPHLKVVLQDQGPTVAIAEQFWAREHPTALEKNRVRFVPFNFFNETPVEGCDFYYLASILHDWPDAESKQILKNVRRAMKPCSRLIIHEVVLRNALSCLDSGTEGNIDLAPHPLLPNYGVARGRMYGLDMVMMSLVNAKERALSEYIDLCQQCGLKFEKLWEAGEMDLIEFIPI